MNSRNIFSISEKDNFFPSVLESIEEGIVVIGLDKRVIFINKTARNLIGLHDGCTEGKLCAGVIKTDLCTMGCPLDTTDDRNSRTSHFININLHNENGNVPAVPLCLNVAPLHDREGNIIGIIENFRPMSEVIKVIESLKKSNITLAQEKNRIDSIVNSLADGVFTVDERLCITSFNKGMEKITGHKESDVLGHICSDVMKGDNCSGDCPLLYTLRNGYGMANIGERITGKGCCTIPVYLSTAFLKDGEGNTELIVTVRDFSEIEKLKKEINDRYQFSNIIGKSSEMQQIFELIETLSDTDCAVLIEGESGTGKELVARAIHHQSDRRDKPFIKVNCSAIVEGLFESELFGHVKGAFSGAIRDKIGKFEYADGGTIFLDEIGEMPLALQPKLLRVLQDKEFEMVGDMKTKKVDVRIIAATNRNIQEEVKLNNFREDLYYRLCVVPIKMPPLRERKEDIPLLINHFLEKCAMKIPNRTKITEITPMALSALVDYDWPGNVRELENAIEHACIRSKTNKIDNDSLPASLKGKAQQGFSKVEIGDTLMSREEMERLFIKKLLNKYNGNKSKVAKDLGLSRTTLWRRFKKYNANVTD